MGKIYLKFRRENNERTDELDTTNYNRRTTMLDKKNEYSKNLKEIGEYNESSEKVKNKSKKIKSSKVKKMKPLKEEYSKEDNTDEEIVNSSVNEFNAFEQSKATSLKIKGTVKGEKNDLSSNQPTSSNFKNKPIVAFTYDNQTNTGSEFLNTEVKKIDPSLRENQSKKKSKNKMQSNSKSRTKVDKIKGNEMNIITDTYLIDPKDSSNAGSNSQIGLEKSKKKKKSKSKSKKKLNKESKSSEALKKLKEFKASQISATALEMNTNSTIKMDVSEGFEDNLGPHYSVHKIGNIKKNNKLDGNSQIISSKM